MGESVTGRTLNFSGLLGIQSAIVRLYRKDTGALVSSTVSGSDSRFSIATGADVVAPFNYFLIAYATDFRAGITDIKKSYLVVNYFISLNLSDTNQDLIRVTPPDSVRNVLRKVAISFPGNATNDGTLEVRNGENGAGSGISVSITAGSRYFSNTGDLRANPIYFYIRNASPSNTGGANIALFYDHPLLQSPY